jgi:hypothetical protein
MKASPGKESKNYRDGRQVVNWQNARRTRTHKNPRTFGALHLFSSPEEYDGLEIPGEL